MGENCSGGIYSTRLSFFQDYPELQPSGGWLAFGETFGEIDVVPGFRIVRSQGMYVREMRAFCVFGECLTELEEGITIEDVCPDPELVPFCGDMNVHQKLYPVLLRKVKYQFKIEDGQVLFSQV